MTISIIIPAKDEEGIIGRCLDCLERQTYKDFEIIVVNDGSTDNTSSIARSKGARVIDLDCNHGTSYARNMGAKQSSGEILYFLDADVLLLAYDFLERLSVHFKINTMYKVDAVGFRVNHVEDSFIQKCTNLRAPKYDSGRRIIENAPESDDKRGFWAIRRSVFNDLNGFNENVFYFEDREFQNRFYSAGYSCLYDGKLTMHSVEPHDLKEFTRAARWLGKGLYQYYRQTGIMYYKALILWFFFPWLSVPWAAYLSLKTGKIIRSFGFVMLHGYRTFIVARVLLKNMFKDDI